MKFLHIKFDYLKNTKAFFSVLFCSIDACRNNFIVHIINYEKFIYYQLVSRKILRFFENVRESATVGDKLSDFSVTRGAKEESHELADNCD